MAKPRGKQIPVGAWWIDEAIVKIQHDPERTVPEVGKELAKIGGREADFSRSLLSRFLNRDPATKITLEFTQAVCKLYDMPMPSLFPRSREEALDLARQASKYPDVDPDRDAAHSRYIEQLEKQLREQEAAKKFETAQQVEQRLAEQAKKAAARAAARRARRQRS